MHKFKNNVSDGWLFKQELRFFRNFATNWNRDVEDCDFFDIFANTANTSEEEAKAVIGSRFDHKELDKIDAIRFHRNEGAETGEFELHGNIDGIIRDIWNRKGWRDECRAMLMEWCDLMEKRKTRRCKRKDPMELRIDEICRVLKLNEVEREVVSFAAVRAMTCFDDFPVGCCNGRHDRELYCAMALDRPCSAITKALSAEGTLRKYEVLDSDGDFGRGNTFRNYLESGDGDMLEGRFYKKTPVEEALPWDFYGKLAEEHGATLKRLIGSSTGKRGSNILLYGEPGTGKTSFAKTLARELGLDLYEIRQGDKDGGNDSAQSRMTGIRICNGQVPKGKSMIIVDEADELLRTSMGFFSMFFGGGPSSTSEKGVINSILDEVRIPTIWISNAPARSMDDSVRRRFDYSIRFEKLNSKQRQAIWRNNVGKLHLGKVISDTMVEQLADRYQTSAGGITMVLENVKRMKPRKGKEMELIDKLMKPHCELMNAKPKDDKLLPSKDYSLDGLNITGDIGLGRIVEAVRKFRNVKDDGVDPDRPRMNLLLWGPPGTGKTEFIKYLGKELNAKVLVKMGSDLLSMYVGGTEQNIKRTFTEAEADNAILFLDEIDGLVQDRSGASKSWEVTQVNELLYQMENFKGVMVGATNFMDNLDQAIMRRFTFKLQFDYLDNAGKRLFFERMFKTKLTEKEAEKLAEVRNLAPGDFRTVRQATYYLGGMVTNSQRIEELEKESSVKRDTKKAGRIGF